VAPRAEFGASAVCGCRGIHASEAARKALLTD
jgi:hypothetical protein